MHIRLLKKMALTLVEKVMVHKGIIRSMNRKDKLHKKYLNEKRFLINKVLHEISKRNRNIIKKG